jgi:hypothetical protein
MSQPSASAQTAEVVHGVEEDHDPRMEGEFQTRLVSDGPRQDVSAYIFYSKVSPDGVRPGEGDLPFLAPEFTDARRVVIHDARGLGKTADENGFELIVHPKPDADYTNDDSIKRVYYPAMMQMIAQK